MANKIIEPLLQTKLDLVNMVRDWPDEVARTTRLVDLIDHQLDAYNTVPQVTLKPLAKYQGYLSIYGVWVKGVLIGVLQFLATRQLRLRVFGGPTIWSGPFAELDPQIMQNWLLTNLKLSGVLHD